MTTTRIEDQRSYLWSLRIHQKHLQDLTCSLKIGWSRPRMLRAVWSSPGSC